ncbi:protein inturned [Scaptodrosophila lebanonensis]|uniref:Protein inturned n=1 Tax=Drosophila lebanonensis TaxID=7225 RepID=A0A6J2UFM4_DROLE|nr:protein inturned [Scaptodrosophila lebanonensis]
MRKSQALLMGGGVGGGDHRLGLDDAASESYSSSSSFSNSYSDGSDLANWEEFVAPDGTLFYAEYVPHARSSSSNPQSATADRRVEFMRRTSSLRLGKKPTRRQQNSQQSQHQTKHNGNRQSQQAPVELVEEFRFAHIKPLQTEQSKQLELVITAADRFRFGRRSTAVESILGFRVLPFVDQPECLMVDGFVHQEQPPIRRGDWFKSLNGIDIRASNVDELLQQFVEPTKVCLGFQGADRNDGSTLPGAASGIDANANSNQVRKLENFAQFAEQFEQLLLQSTSTTELETPTPFAMLILPPECYQQDQHKDSLYYYPESADGGLSNFLYKARGSFLTINAVLSDELQTKPRWTRLLVDSVAYNVNYRALNGFLVLFAFTARDQTAAECALRSDELIGYMRFAFPGLCLDNFANANETTSGLRAFLKHFCNIQRVRLLARPRAGVQFEELLWESRLLALPKEAQLRIFDALSEMEAMDYRNWNDEPLTTHREFFIYGCVLYYDSYLLASQLPVEVRANVERFLRCRGIFDFIGAQNVRELYVWEEIALANATGRYFLTICTRSHLILAVILKIFDAPDMAPNATIPPSLFYIEEIQETLDHLIQCGIESLAMFWSISNKRPEVLDKVESTADTGADEKESKLETFLKQKLTVSSPSSHASVLNDDEVQLCSSLGGSSIHSLTPSEDDSSRKRLTPNHAEDSDSGSDWENFAEQHPLHYGLDVESQSQMTESLWKEINNVVPVKISAGWKNAVYYYVYVDTANGSLFCPLKANSELFPFVCEMRKACHIIHAVLERSKKFRQPVEVTKAPPVGGAGPGVSSSSGTSVSNKDISVVKEHGITMEVKGTAKEQGGKPYSVRFVVIGRLFNSPAKEVYVCHRPEVPQNMVEMAFRLSFFPLG